MTIKFSETYYLVSLPFHQNMDYIHRRNQRNVDRATVEGAGFKSQYQFASRKTADLMAAKIKKRTGIEMDVGEAFGMMI